MNNLRLAIMLPLLLATAGSRSQPRLTSAGHANEHPATSACLLGSGFDLQRGCQYPEAMQPVPKCENANFDQACDQVSNAERVRGYMRDVRSSSDYSSLTRSVTEAEGGGFGVSVSASFAYMKRSQVSEKSLAFFIGANGRTQTRTIQRPVALNLTSAAKDLLKRDPRQFITRHGLRYIHSITYGGSFLGSVTLNSRQTTDDRDVQACASLSVNKGFFSASGSTEFQNTISQQNLNVDVKVDAEWVGGSGIKADFRSPETLNKMFTNWNSAWRANSVPLTVTTRRWTDSADVQSIVNSMPEEDQALFDSPDITFGIRREISEEHAKIALVDTSVRKALAWKEIQGDRATESCLKSLLRKVTAKLMRINLLDDSKVLIIQHDWLTGDYSWFEADSMHDGYLDCVKNVQPDPTEAPTEAPHPTDRLLTDGKLLSGQHLASSNGITLVMQEDGNLVLYARSGRTGVIWASNTDSPGSDLILQSDGNLVIYAPGDRPVWESNTEHGGSLIVQDDCNLVLYSATKRVEWATNTDLKC